MIEEFCSPTCTGSSLCKKRAARSERCQVNQCWALHTEHTPSAPPLPCSSTDHSDGAVRSPCSHQIGKQHVSSANSVYNDTRFSLQISFADFLANGLFKSILAFLMNVLSHKYLLTSLKIVNQAQHGWGLLKSKFPLHACISNAAITNETEG